MKYLLIIFLSFLPSLALAQEEEDDPVSECATVLAAPPFVDILTRNEGSDFHQIDVRDLGYGLVGSFCTVEVLTEYFEAAGWEFVSVTRSEPSGPWGSPISYYTDTYAKFCKKGRGLFTFYLRGCVQGVGVDFFENKISFVNAGAIK